MSTAAQVIQTFPIWLQEDSILDACLLDVSILWPHTHQTSAVSHQVGPIGLEISFVPASPGLTVANTYPVLPFD